VRQTTTEAPLLDNSLTHPLPPPPLSYLVLFVYLHLIQFFLLPVLLSNTFFSLLLSNVLYLLAFSHYFYVTHLGYRALPFLRNTEYFLYPVVAMCGLAGLR